MLVRLATADDIGWVKPMIDRHKKTFGFIPRPVFVEAVGKGELLVVTEKAFCHFHKRRDGVCVIYEILSEQAGCGLALLMDLPHPILAKCPVGEQSNSWYPKMGFRLDKIQEGKKRDLNVWMLD